MWKNGHDKRSVLVSELVQGMGRCKRTKRNDRKKLIMLKKRRKEKRNIATRSTNDRSKNSYKDKPSDLADRNMKECRILWRLD
jgi:hypothetical protein